MKFVDSVKIVVIAGKGGDGCVSFKKNKKNRRLVKANGSNGGCGGDVYLSIDPGMNTLSYFSYNRIFRAKNGSKGYSKNCTGKKGKDLTIKVPEGTKVFCQSTCQLLGDMVKDYNTSLIVAKGGRCGLGNSNFRYSVRKQSNLYNKNKGFAKLNSSRTGSPGELRHLLLELILMADVGVFGLPNSGKSSFLKAISEAKPKIANYPFTTLVPNLGTVKLNNYDNTFVVADIPGIIKGASMGLGLGIQFLKHLERCRMLLHFVDISVENQSDPVENILTIEQELYNYSSALALKKKWLVFNKIDLLNEYELKKKINYIIKSISWSGRYYMISVENNTNIILLCNDIMDHIKHDRDY